MPIHPSSPSQEETRQGSPPQSRHEAFFQLAVPSDPADLILHVTDPVLVQRARKALTKCTPTYVMASVVPEPAWYNPPWSFYVDSHSLEFSEHPPAIETGTSTFQDIDRLLFGDRRGKTGPLLLPRMTQLQREIPRADVRGDLE
jgi:hypothetical protein